MVYRLKYMNEKSGLDSDQDFLFKYFRKHLWSQRYKSCYLEESAMIGLNKFSKYLQAQ